MRETPPAEAVYGAARHLKHQGHLRAYEATLRYLIDQYPDSRAAAGARDDLEQLGASSQPPDT